MRFLFWLAGKGDLGLIHEIFFFFVLTPSHWSTELHPGWPPSCGYLHRDHPPGAEDRETDRQTGCFTAQIHLWVYLAWPHLHCVQSHIQSRRGCSLHKLLSETEPFCSPCSSVPPCPPQPSRAICPRCRVAKHTGVN